MKAFVQFNITKPLKTEPKCKVSYGRSTVNRIYTLLLSAHLAGERSAGNKNVVLPFQITAGRYMKLDLVCRRSRKNSFGVYSRVDSVLVELNRSTASVGCCKKDVEDVSIWIR